MAPRDTRILENTEFDLIIVGGGITGAGIARDAALRGLRVALLEKGDLARGTSSASSKLIHGGLRYLEQLELGLVREGVSERAVLTRVAPHLARPLPFLFPIYRTGPAGPLKIKAGMLLYDALALFKNYRNHRMLPARATARAEPQLLREGLRGSTVYYDCMTDDARLTVETALDAEAHGAVIATYFEVTRFRRDPSGRITGVHARDTLETALAGNGSSAREVEVRGKLTLVAAGPWTDQVLGLAGDEQRPLLRPTKGVHIVFDRARLPIDHAIVLRAVRDDRVLFAIPWGERTVIGTTDTDDKLGPERCDADAADVDYLIETSNHYFPELHARESDVLSTWAGLRPLMAHDAATASEVSREHEIRDVTPGLMVIAGGKLTTYRLMAEQAVDRVAQKLGSRRTVLERCRTKTTPLPGAANPEALADLGRAAAGLARAHGLEPDVALHLIHSYGLRAPAVLLCGREAGVGAERIAPDLPYVWAEVAFAAQAEHALRLDDALRRRTNIFLKDVDQGLGVAARAAAIMGRVLGWDAARERLEVERYRTLVGASRAYRSAPAPAPKGAPAAV
jgi:glycerol-3-phosphate dehydrogenase